MAGPFLPARAAQPLDLLADSVGSGGWEELEELLKPRGGVGELQPDDKTAMFLYGLYHTPQGRDLFEWLMDITIRQPLRITGRTFEETALQAAGRQVLNGVGEVLLKAVAHGEQVLQQSRNQNGAGS